MKKLVFFLFSIINFCIFYSSCNSGEEGLGDLYAVWKVNTFECNTMSAHIDTVFIAFQKYEGKYYFSYEANWHRRVGNYILNDNKLTLRNGGSFKEMYLEDSNVTFDIDKFNSKEIILRKNDSIWTLTKFLDKF